MEVLVATTMSTTLWQIVVQMMLFVFSECVTVPDILVPLSLKLSIYELTLEYRTSATDSTRVCGVDLVESFAGQTGPLVVVTRCEEDGGQPRNRACAFRIADIDGDMDAYFTGCRAGVHSESDLPWDVPSPCSQFTVSNSLKLTETFTFYYHRERILVILEILALLLSMWKRLLNPIHNDLGSTWSILSLAS